MQPSIRLNYCNEYAILLTIYNKFNCANFFPSPTIALVRVETLVAVILFYIANNINDTGTINILALLNYSRVFIFHAL